MNNRNNMLVEAINMVSNSVICRRNFDINIRVLITNDSKPNPQIMNSLLISSLQLGKSGTLILLQNGAPFDNCFNVDISSKDTLSLLLKYGARPTAQQLPGLIRQNRFKSVLTYYGYIGGENKENYDFISLCHYIQNDRSSTLIRSMLRRGTVCNRFIDTDCILMHLTIGLYDLDEFLKEIPFYINMPNAHGITPLMAAAYRGLNNQVSCLLKYGANPNQKDRQGNTSLHYALKGHNNDLAAMLRLYNADDQSRNINNQTPAEYASS